MGYSNSVMSCGDISINQFLFFFLPSAYDYLYFIQSSVSLSGFELTDCESRFAIHLHYFSEHFLLSFMKFGNQFLKAHRSFDIVVEYCFTLILLTTARFVCSLQCFFTWHSLVKYLLLSCLIA